MSEESGIAFASEVSIQTCDDRRPNNQMYFPNYGYDYPSNRQEFAQSCTIDISAGNKVDQFYRLQISSRCRTCTATSTIKLCSRGELCGMPLESINVSS